MKRVLVFVLLVLGGFAIFVFGWPYYSILPTNGNQLYAVILTVCLLALSLWLKGRPSLASYWRSAYALFVASAALLFLNTGLLNLHDPSMDPLPFIALDKLSQFLHVVPVILLLTLLAGEDLRSIFLAKGRLRQTLTFGLISFAAFAAAAFALQAGAIAGFGSLPAAMPWLLLFVVANGVMEELWFRAIFLRQYEAVMGGKLAILSTALVFGASHIGATYAFPGGPIVFGLVVFGLGVVGAYAMRKDKSLIGPVLFHAGYDLMIIVPILHTV